MHSEMFKKWWKCINNLDKPAENMKDKQGHVRIVCVCALTSTWTAVFHHLINTHILLLLLLSVLSLHLLPLPPSLIFYSSRSVYPSHFALCLSFLSKTKRLKNSLAISWYVAMITALSLSVLSYFCRLFILSLLCFFLLSSPSLPLCLPDSHLSLPSHLLSWCV